MLMPSHLGTLATFNSFILAFSHSSSAFLKTQHFIETERNPLVCMMRKFWQQMNGKARAVVSSLVGAQSAIASNKS